jgi:hypothetical protein
MSAKSVLLKYYLHRVAAMIGTPKIQDTHDRRTRKVRRQAKGEYDSVDRTC